MAIKLGLYILLAIIVGGAAWGIYAKIKDSGRVEQLVKDQNKVIDGFEKSMQEVGAANVARHSIVIAPDRLRDDDGYRRD